MYLYLFVHMYTYIYIHISLSIHIYIWFACPQQAFLVLSKVKRFWDFTFFISRHFVFLLFVLIVLLFIIYIHTHMLHDWQTLPTCREIFHTWSIWDMHISLHPIFCIRMFGDPRTQKNRLRQAVHAPLQVIAPQVQQARGQRNGRITLW